METYYERSLHSKYRSQGVKTSFYESTPSPTNSLGDQISSGSTRNLGHAGTNFPYAPKECDHGGAPKLTRVLLERIPGKESYRGMASSHRPKESERSHSGTSFPYVHDKLCAKLRPKRRLRVQNRSAGCVLSRTDSSQQQKIPQVRLRKQCVPVSSATIRSEHSPSSFYSIGPYSVRLPAPSGDLGDTISGRLAIHHPDPEVLLRHQAQLLNTLDLVSFVLNRKKSELDLTQDIQFLEIRLRLALGEASLPESKAWEIVARARHLSSLHVLSYTQVSQLMGSLNWASGLIPLGRLYLRPLQRHFHSLGLTDRFLRFRRSSQFLRTPPRRGGALTWGIPRFRVPGPIQTACFTSIVWSSRRYFMPYGIGLKCSRATRL